MVHNPEKMFRNILTFWHTFHGFDDIRIRGKVVLDQPSAGVSAGDIITTSPIVGIYVTADGKRWLETKNSLYILSNEGTC